MGVGRGWGWGHIVSDIFFIHDGITENTTWSVVNGLREIVHVNPTASRELTNQKISVICKFRNFIPFGIADL